MIASIKSSIQPPVTVVGTVALDVVHHWDVTRKVRLGTEINLGGVCKHVACALGQFGLNPKFVSTQFTGELGVGISYLLSVNAVNWQPLDVSASPSLFEGHLDLNDTLFAEDFVEGEALSLMTEERLRNHQAIRQANVLVSCTNLSVESLNGLARLATETGAAFWLLTASAADAPRISRLRYPIDVLSLNIDELRMVTGQKLDSATEIGKAALSIAQIACVVTMGNQGAFFCSHEMDHLLHQPVDPISGRSPVGAGDILFAGLLAGKLFGQTWEDSFSFGASATRRYLLRPSNSATPYITLAEVKPVVLPPMVHIPFVEKGSNATL